MNWFWWCQCGTKSSVVHSEVFTCQSVLVDAAVRSVVYTTIYYYKNFTYYCRCTVTEILFKLFSILFQVINLTLPINQKQQKWHQNKECVSQTKELQKTSHFVEMFQSHRYAVFYCLIKFILIVIYKVRWLKYVNCVKINNYFRFQFWGYKL